MDKYVLPSDISDMCGLRLMKNRNSHLFCTAQEVRKQTLRSFTCLSKRVTTHRIVKRELVFPEKRVNIKSKHTFFFFFFLSPRTEDEATSIYLLMSETTQGRGVEGIAGVLSNYCLAIANMKKIKIISFFSYFKIH